MYINSDKPEIKLLLHKALNLVESIEARNCFVPRAKAIVITKIEEALLWLDYKGRQAPPEQMKLPSCIHGLVSDCEICDKK